MMVVLVVIMVLAQFMIYPTQRALEQSRADIAVAGLRRFGPPNGFITSKTKAMRRT